MTIRSLFMGLTGLNSMGKSIDVIGNNIANANTVGFRAGRASFDDIFYSTLFSGVGNTGATGGINPRQIGTGSKLGSVDLIFTQGSPQTTGRLLDLAVNGDGFFVLRDGAGQEFLTRAGNFSLDDDGFVVDPGTGLRVVGQTADENGLLLDTEAPDQLQVDFARKSLAKQTTLVRGAGNFNAEIGDPTKDKEVAPASSTTNMLGLFDTHGEAFGLINGDVIGFETGFMEIDSPPKNVQSPLNLTEKAVGGKGNGVLMTITDTTTVEDLEDSLNNFFSETIANINSGTASGLKIKFDSISGTFEFINSGKNSLKGLRIGVLQRDSLPDPPEDATRLIGNLFINEGDPDFTKTLNVLAGNVVRTNSIRRADTTTSIDVFDSKGNSHTITVGMAVDTHPPAATANALVGKLRDNEGRLFFENGIVPPQPVYSDPVIDARDHTAVFSAYQVSNIVATQGVFTFLDGSATPNLIALRFSDGAVSFNGGTFNVPIQSDGTIDTEFSENGIDVTNDNYLNIASDVNSGTGGLLGDDGFTDSTTLEDIRRNMEERINTSIRQVATGILNVDPASTLDNVPASGFTAVSAIPSISVTLTKDGSFSFAATGGSLGASASSDATINANLATAAGGEDQLGFVLDLAAKTRSIRISTIDPKGTLADPTDDFGDGVVDNDYTDGGGISGFIDGADPFATDLTTAFDIGNTDFDDMTVTGNPTLGDPGTAVPTGIDDSGVQLIAMNSGKYMTTDDLTLQRFSAETAFTSETTAFRAIFNPRGYGIASDFDGTTGNDRTTGVAVGIVAASGAPTVTESNTIHKDGLTRSTVNYQAVTPNDFRTVPTQTTGAIIFDSTGRFQSYDGEDDAPTITFDVDQEDPENGGVSPMNFKLDLSGITHFAGHHTAQLQSQDGRPTGTLDNVSIGTSGEILGIFTNGDTQSLGKILLSKVTNNGGLIQQGAALFTVGPNAGDRIFVEAGVEGGEITSGALELSNVDLAQEFTNLIVAQRSYQANARVVTTADQILTEAVNLKR